MSRPFQFARVYVVWSALIALALLSACGDTRPAPPPQELTQDAPALPQAPHMPVPVPNGSNPSGTTIPDWVYVWTDPATGCDYIIARPYLEPAITPRYQPNGSLFCAAEEGA